MSGPAARMVWVTSLGILILLIACGSLYAPYSPTSPIGLPYSPPGGGALLGTDQLGRDVLSRVLSGGLPVLSTSLIAALLGSGLGTALGLTAAALGRRHRWAEGIVLRPCDALAALPPIMVLLLALSALPGRVGIIVAVALASLPLSARVVRAAAAPVVSRAHVEVAFARGEKLTWVLRREVLPLVAGTVVADLGLRFVLALYLVTAAGFLGLGTSGSDWGQLIVEALPGATLQPLALAVPVSLVAALAISVNLIADSILRRSRRVLA